MNNDNYLPQILVNEIMGEKYLMERNQFNRKLVKDSLKQIQTKPFKDDFWIKENDFILSNMNNDIIQMIKKTQIVV